MFDKKQFTPRNVARYMTNTLVQLTVTAGVKYVLTTDKENQSSKKEKSIDMTAYLVGWYVSDRLEPVTDQVADKFVDVIESKKQTPKQIAS